MNSREAWKIVKDAVWSVPQDGDAIREAIITLDHHHIGRHYHPPKQAQSTYSFYQAIDRRADMLIWWININRLRRGEARISHNMPLRDKRDLAIDYMRGIHYEEGIKCSPKKQ